MRLVALLSSKKTNVIHAHLRELVLGGKWQAGEKLPTETELAEEFACSISTISKAVGLLAHEGLVERKPRAGTRVLVGQSPNAVTPVGLESFAFIYPAKKHEGIWRAAKGFQDAAHDCSQRVTMLSTGLDYHREAEFMTRLSEFAVKGAVVYPGFVSNEAQSVFVKAVAASRFPIVLTAHNPLGLDCPVVTLDGFHAGYTMTRHLIDRGALRIGYLSDRARSFSMRERYLGYRHALEEAGLASQDSRVSLNSSMNVDLLDPMREPEAMAQTYLAQATDIDAVVCSTDFLAAATIKAASAAGLSVPGQLRVVGMDDYDFAAQAEIPLTTYRIPYQEIGETAFRLLSAMAAGQKTSPMETLLRGRLVTRASS